MRTSQEIYHQVRWDARFDASRFVVGVEQRGREPKRVPLPSFDPRGEIPWHRVVFFEADGEVVWDRGSGVDLLDASGSRSGSGLARSARLLAAPFFEPRTPHAFAGGHWVPAAGAGAGAGSVAGADVLRILTWNTLWDRYDSDLIHTAERRLMLIDALREAEVDVIALQEVEPALVKMLLAEEWVRAEWMVGGDPRSSDVADAGVFVLSRLPIHEAGWHELGRHKALTAIVVEVAGRPVVVADTHLSSDHSRDGAGLRWGQLTQIEDGLRSIEGTPVVLVGDFNDDTDVPATHLAMADAWTQIHGPADQTPTFDPVTNPLAAVSSLSGEAKRLDRVLLRGGGALGARLVGDVADAGGLFVSDHFGIAAVVGVAGRGRLASSPVAEFEAAPTARTAVAWIPPTEMWEGIQEVRQRLDPQILRWPPHVNILFGFVPESEFDAALPLVSRAAAACAPFETELDELRHFTHRNDSTLWLHPSGDGWQGLYAALVEAFPRCRSRESFTPHLTIGKVADPSRSQVRIPALRAEVGTLAVLSRRGDGVMEVRALVGLGSGAVVEVGGAVEELVSEELELAGADGSGSGSGPGSLATRITEALPEAKIHIVGSRRTGTHLPGADLDLVAAMPGEPDIDAVERRVAEALGDGHRVRQLVAARVPGLRIVAPGLTADLVLAPVGEIPVGEAVARRAELGETIASSLSAVSDAEAILALRPGPHVRWVKAWARARGLDAAPLGGLPGLAWAWMAAGCRDIENFFETWAAHDWLDPIPTPTAPIRDLTLHLTPATRDLIAEELYNGWEIVTSSREPLRALLAAPPMHRRHRGWAVVSLVAEDIGRRDVLEGRVRGRTRSLLTAFDEAGVAEVHAWPRAFYATDTELRMAIGLGRRPPTREELAEIARPWLRGLGGVGVELVDNGGVPTLV
jgi:endonuclease/exonuclease/phosphatase family metal-dependent hydrolase/2'-5' RNA ligase/uncharacterized protein (UPF0248 family)